LLGNEEEPPKTPRGGTAAEGPLLASRAADSVTSSKVPQHQGWVTRATAPRRRLSRGSSSPLWWWSSRCFSSRPHWTMPIRLAHIRRSTKTVPPCMVYEDSSETAMISSAQKQAQKASQGQEPLTTDTTSTKAAQIASRVSRPPNVQQKRTKIFHGR
jgi:hypothetical protein